MNRKQYRSHLLLELKSSLYHIWLHKRFSKPFRLASKKADPKRNIPEIKRAELKKSHLN